MLQKKEELTPVGLFVEGGVNLVDHILEGFRLVEYSTLLDEPFGMVKKLGLL
jgi:hypothetical protein